MKTYKSNLPQITLKLTKSDMLNCKISNSNDAYGVFKKIWDADSIEIYESMICIFLNRANNTIGWYKISQGGISGTVIDIKLILSTALKCLASSIIIAHNHPSGNLVASESDTRITEKLKNACKIMEITLIDHLIITENGYFSYKDENII